MTTAGKRLTQRQRQVLRLVSQGKQHPEIADELAIKVTSVRGHLSAAFRRLGVHNAPHAVACCFERGIFTTDESG